MLFKLIAFIGIGFWVLMFLVVFVDMEKLHKKERELL